VRGRVIASEDDVPDERLPEYVVSWPGKWPKGARGSAAPSSKEAARDSAAPSGKASARGTSKRG
jgi:hypothetical protein